MSDSIFKRSDFFLDLKVTLDRSKRHLYPKEILTLKTFSRRRATDISKISNFETLCFHKYLSKSVTTVMALDSRIDAGIQLQTSGHMNKESLLKLDDSFDGVAGEVLASKVIKDIHNELEPISALVEIKTFVKDTPTGTKLPANFNKFAKLIKAMEDNITDINMQSGVMRSKANDKDFPYVNIDIFCGDDYILSYNTMPKKSHPRGPTAAYLINNTDVRFSYRNNDSYYSKKIAITTIGRNNMTIEEIKDLLKLSYIDNTIDHGANNLSDNCMEINSLRSLVGVI